MTAEAILGRFKVSIARAAAIPIDAEETRKRRLSITPAIISAAGNHILPQTIRDDTAIADTELDDLALPVSYGLSNVYSPSVQSTLSEVEDRRLFHPDSVKPSKTVRGSKSSVIASAPAVAHPQIIDTVPWGIGFKSKAHVIICIRRHSRRAVILATGKGGGRHRRPRKNDNSMIWC